MTVTVTLSACAAGSGNGSGSGSTGPAAVFDVGHFAVGSLTRTFVEARGVTPAWNGAPSHRGRTLVTTIFYPSGSAHGTGGSDRSADHTADSFADPSSRQRPRGPFPLVVFAHGFGSGPVAYAPLLKAWASAGYVVAAPLFPMTRFNAPGGPYLADYVRQPADMSYVISKVLEDSASGRGALAGLVDPDRIGAAGHSLGGVTTLGLVANSCCRDGRVKAAVIMSGDPLTFRSGRPDYADAPPMLLVHGTADPSVPYSSSVDVFNAATGPKGLLTIEGGNHASPVDPLRPYFLNVIRTTTDFFDAYLKNDKGALPRMSVDARTASTELVFVARNSPRVTLPVPTTTATTRQAQAVPDTALTDGQTVTVSWEGYTPGVSVNILECSNTPPTAAGDCDLATGKFLEPDPQGRGTIFFTVHTGAVGTGTCDKAHDRCVLVVNEGGSTAPSSSAIVPISFGGS